MLENRQKHEELGAQIRHGEAVTHSNKSADRADHCVLLQTLVLLSKLILILLARTFRARRMVLEDLAESRC
jgi:hypothetical protein